MSTYSLSPLNLGLAHLIFLLDFMGPCLTRHLGILYGLGTGSSVEGSVDSSPSSSRNCLDALALFHMTSAWGRSSVNLEVDGMASALADHWKNVGLSGGIGILS